jgi:ATP-binding cassette subfamily B protein
MNAIAVSLMTSLLVLGALWYGGLLVIRNQMTTGELAAYLFYLAMLFRPVSEFIKASAYLQAGRVAVQTVFSVFENHQPVEEPIHPIKPVHREGGLSFQNVWYQRSGGGASVRGVNFNVKPGEKVLVIGPSGSGKSTILNLLLRLYDPDRGTIILDGVNIRRLKLDDARDYFTVVTQDQLHPDDSVLANLVLGATDQAPSLGETLRGLDEFQLAEKVALRERKLDQRIDGSGQGFSRGELQKVALLRAAAREAPIVLLDEPTASMDAASERRAMDFIGRVFKEKTVVMVSHRPHPLFHADWILMLREGRMEAQGSHHYLFKNSPEYRKWLNPQAPSERIERVP